LSENGGPEKGGPKKNNRCEVNELKMQVRRSASEGGIWSYRPAFSIPAYSGPPISGPPFAGRPFSTF